LEFKIKIMKNALTTLALLAVIAGGVSVAYYYGFYLPQKGVLIQATTPTPTTQTPQQAQAQKQANIDALHAQDAKMNAYSQCMSAYSKAMDVYLTSQCSNKGLDMMKEMSCRSNAMSSFTYRDCREELF